MNFREFMAISESNAKKVSVEVTSDRHDGYFFPEGKWTAEDGLTQEEIEQEILKVLKKKKFKVKNVSLFDNRGYLMRGIFKHSKYFKNAGTWMAN
jgi:hypothetical protein